MKLLLLFSVFIAFCGATTLTQSPAKQGRMWVRKSMGKSWKVRRVENIDDCCSSCAKKGETRNKPELIAFHYQQRKQTCVCFSRHPKGRQARMTKRKGFKAGKCMKEEPNMTEPATTAMPSTSSIVPASCNGSGVGSGSGSSDGSNGGSMIGSGGGSDFASGSGSSDGSGDVSNNGSNDGSMIGSGGGSNFESGSGSSGGSDNASNNGFDNGGVIQSSTSPGQKWITATLGKSWRVSVGDMSRCCAECQEESENLDEDHQVVAFHFQASKSRCYCFGEHSAGYPATLTSNPSYEAGRCTVVQDFTNSTGSGSGSGSGFSSGSGFPSGSGSSSGSGFNGSGYGSGYSSGSGFPSGSGSSSGSGFNGSGYGSSSGSDFIGSGSGSGFSSGSGSNGSGNYVSSGFSSGTGSGISGTSSGVGSGQVATEGEGLTTTTAPATTTQLTVPSAGEVVQGVRWVDATVTYEGHHHENVDNCCISCNEDEEVWFVHVQDNDCYCFNPRSGVQEELETAAGFEARVCTDAEREGDY